MGFVTDQSESLEIIKARLELAVEGAGLGMWEWNPQTDAVVFDDRWAQMLGLKPSDLTQTLLDWSSRVHPDDLPECFEKIKAHVDGEEPVYESTHRMRHTDGGWRWILDRGKVVERDESGLPVRFTGTHLDVTHLKEREAALAQTTFALEKALAHEADIIIKQRKMFGIIAHELRTPAAAIKMTVDHAWDETDARKILSGAIDKLLSVVDDLRQAINPDESVRIHIATFSILDLIKAINNRISAMFTDAKVKYHFATDFSSEQWYVSDVYRLESIVTNLVRNARIHSDANNVWVSISKSRIDDDSDQVLFVVEDDGKGIPASIHNKIFEPFVRGESQSTGTGVGLYIVREWSRELHGDVRLLTGRSGGARFEVSIPMTKGSHDDDQAGAQSKREGALALLDGSSVLLVEDDPLLRRLTRTVLQKNTNAVIVEAQNGVEAIALLKRHRPALIITDYFMPEMDGRALIQALRRVGNTVPIIGLTAATIGEERDELLVAGANEVLNKPLDIMRLSRALNTLRFEGKF